MNSQKSNRNIPIPTYTQKKGATLPVLITGLDMKKKRPMEVLHGAPEMLSEGWPSHHLSQQEKGVLAD